jgi:superfamily I DNA/RNA helicase
LIDEAHDFEDAWLRLAPQLVDPTTNSLLVLYDDAQSIYRQPRRKFSFASVGIEARGRTSVLKVNYRNTAEVLQLATATAGQLLGGQEPGGEDDDIVHTAPLAAGRHGPLPVLLRSSSPQEEADLVADQIADALADGVQPADIGLLARRHDLLDPIERTLRERGIATQRLKGRGSREWQGHSVKLTTLHASKGLEFHTVAIVGLQAVPDLHETEDEEMRLLYVAMTRATHRLVLSTCGASVVVKRIATALGHGQYEERVA